MSKSIARDYLTAISDAERAESDITTAQNRLDSAKARIEKYKKQLLDGITDQQPIRVYTWKDQNQVVHVTAMGVQVIKAEPDC